MKRFLLAMVFASTSFVGAQAATLTNLGSGQDAYDLIDPTMGTDLQAGVSFDAFIRTGSVSVSRSPYDNSGTASVPNFQQLDYFSIGPSNTPSPATLTLSVAANTLNFLWGSPDTYNSIQLFSGATLLDTIFGADVIASTSEPAGLGASYVSIFSQDAFDRAVFVSGSNALEVANISVSPVPLPAGVVLLLSAVGGLGAMRMRQQVA